MKKSLLLLPVYEQLVQIHSPYPFPMPQINLYAMAQRMHSRVRAEIGKA